MPKSKRDWDAVVEDVIKHDKKNPPKPKRKAKPKPAAKAKAKPKKKPVATKTEKRGRKPTVDYDRDDQLTFPLTSTLNDRLAKAVAIEGGKRHPKRVDKGLIIEEALKAWFAKRGY